MLHDQSLTNFSSFVFVCSIFVAGELNLSEGYFNVRANEALPRLSGLLCFVLGVCTKLTCLQVKMCHPTSREACLINLTLQL